MLIFRNAKTGEIVVGSEDRVEQCHYAAVITRFEEELDNELTGGWKIVEVSRSAATRLLRNILTILPSDGSSVRSPVPIVALSFRRIAKQTLSSCSLPWTNIYTYCTTYTARHHTPLISKYITYRDFQGHVDDSG